MRALWLDIVTELWHYPRKWWAIEYFSCSMDPRHNYEQMAEDLSCSFLSSFLPPPLYSVFQLLYIFLSNFSECSKLLHADILFCFCLLNIWAALVMVADWKDQEALFNSSLFVQEKLKAKNAIQALLSTLRDDTHISANVLLSCLTSFSSFFLSV